MKNVFKIIFSILTIIILIAAIAFISVILYITFTSNKQVSEIIQHSANEVASVNDEPVIEKKETKNVGEIISELLIPTIEEKDDYTDAASLGKFYYEQLSDTQKNLYNGLQSNKEKLTKGTYVIEYGEKFSKLLETESGIERLQADYQTAVEAFTHDNPDLFFLDVSKMYLNIETTKKLWSVKYNVYIGPSEGKKYTDDRFTSEQEILDAKYQIESIKNQIVNSLGTDTYKNIKKIHDSLINNIEYDQKYTSKSTYTIYGALIERKCVCDGYARAFKYIANAAGIECELIQGTATNSSGKTENHAWNAVKLNGKWYYIDVTWDDPIIVGKGIVLNKYYYQYFLKGKKAFEGNHTINGVFSDGGKEFKYPDISNTDY